MIRPLTYQEAVARYEGDFETAIEKEERIRKMRYKERMEIMEKENKMTAKLAMAEEIKKNLEKLQRRFKTEIPAVDPTSFIPGLAKKKNAAPAVPEKTAKPKTVVKKTLVFNEKEQAFLNLWRTTLDPLAKPFEFRGMKSNGIAVTTGVDQQQIQHKTNGHISLLSVPNVKYTANSLPSEILMHIFSYLASHVDIKRIQGVSKHWQQVATDPFLWERKHLVCFHTKKSYEEDVLGIGVKLKFNPKSHKLEYISTELDLMSHTAFFKLGVRKTAWQESFTHYVPLYLNREHGKKAMAVLEASICAITNAPKFNPELCLDLYCKLMNTMVVSVMSENVHASIKALQGYCFFHRMLLAIVDKYPHLRTVINNRIKNFIIKEENRHKRVVSSLGDFLPLLTVSEYNWKQLASPVLKETFDRNVLWITKVHPELATARPEYDEEKERERAEKSFKAVNVSLRLLMFQIYFLTNVANRKAGETLQTLAERYDKRFGLPTDQQQQQLQQAVFDLMKVNDYFGFFEKAQLPLPSEQTLHEVLRQSVNSSIEKRYHNPFFKPKKFVPAKKKDKSRPTLNMDDEY
jgi:hypothetical protein